MINDSSTRSFPAKLLLFGEHVLLLGQPALAIPLQAFSGQWSWNGTKGAFTDRLFEFAQSKVLKESGVIDTTSFQQALETGLWFDSNVPVGYGLGSSGALCAAVYERFGKEKTEDLIALKRILAGMESFFHGNSSGIDPLTSYVAEPILIRNQHQVERASGKPWKEDKPVVFLIDSGLPRKSKPLVEWFLGQQENPGFVRLLSDIYFPVHQALIQAWLSADAASFWQHIKGVSSFQFEHFEPMIPHTLRDLWKNSLESADLTLKICGAGGGGFMLGFARDKAVAEDLAKQFSLVIP